MNVGATAFVHGTNSASIVGEDNHSGITSSHGLKNICYNLDSDGFQPTDVPTRNLPGGYEFKSGSLALDDDSNTPWGASIYEDTKVERRASRNKLTVEKGGLKLFRPPFQV
jgi:hypothetical protein